MAKSKQAAKSTKSGEWWSEPLPVRLGWLNDMPEHLDNIPIVEFVLERFNKLKRIDRDVELCMVRVKGAPAGRIKNVYDGWLALKEMGCLAIMGPSHSDA